MGLDLVQVGSVLGDRYEIRRLHRSAPGLRTWEAFDPVLNRIVVVDTLDPRNTSATRDAFLSAALRSARCTDHGVIKVYDTGTARGTAYVVSEFVSGTPLDTFLDGALSLESTAALACELADALAAAHATGLFHGALQPASILVTEGNRVKIGGFGGPPTGDRYCAPEVLGGSPASEAADVYGLAVCITEMLRGDAFDPRTTPVADALRDRSDLPDGVRVTLARALDPSPAARAAHLRALQRTFAPHRRVVSITPDQQATETVPVAVPEPTVAVPVTVAPGPTPPTPPPDEGLVAPGRSRIPLAFTLLVIAAVTAGFVVTALYTLRNPLDLGQGPAGSPSPPAIATVTDFDPFGDNGQENRAAVGNTHDGDPATGWSSEIYTTPTFGNAKPGIGLRIDLVESARVVAVSIDTDQPGWSADVYVGDGRADTLDGWGKPVATTRDAAARTTLTLASKPQTRSILVWFTRLPPGGRITVQEVRVRG